MKSNRTRNFIVGGAAVLAVVAGGSAYAIADGSKEKEKTLTTAETAKADCPQLPTTPEEIARTAAECEAAGAAMIHLHVRDGEHAPTLDQALLREWVAAVREFAEKQMGSE